MRMTARRARQAGRQADGQTERQADRQPDTETDHPYTPYFRQKRASFKIMA
jgi:hypothetical protein